MTPVSSAVEFVWLHIMPSYNLLFSCLLFLGWVAAPSLASGLSNAGHRKICTVKPGGSNLTDDAPAILKAFRKCGHGGTINFLKKTYYINSVMNTTGLHDCEVNLPGTLLVWAHFDLPKNILADFPTVGNKYSVLAQQFSPRRLSESIYSLGVWGR